MSAAAAPTKLSQLLDFVSARSESLSETPDVSELADFASGCHDNFVATYGEESDVHPTPTLMLTLVHLTPIVKMEEAFITVTELESQHRILTAADFSRTIVPRATDAPSIKVDALEKLVFSTAKYNNDTATLAGYGQHVPANLRPFIIAATIKAGSLFSTLWGFFLAYQDATMTDFFNVVDDFANDRFPLKTEDQQGTICSRHGLIIGWNCAMDAVETIFSDHLETLAASTRDMRFFVVTMQSICRRALTDTATSFAGSIKEWRLSGRVTYDGLDDAFDNAFQRIIREVAPRDANEEELRFSLRTDTASVRHVRPFPNPNEMQQAPRHGRSFASVMLNVLDRVVEVIGMQPTEKRRRLNIAAPPQVTAPVAAASPPPPPLTQAQIDRNAVVAEERDKMAKNLRKRRENRVFNK